jgi:hypothetical protein
MPIDFPSSPTTGQVYTYEGKSWVYNGTGWDSPRALSEIGAVQTFANAAARTAAIPTPTEGIYTHLNDVDALQVYNGSAWGSPFGSTLVGSSTFTAQTSVVISDCFTSEYQNYAVFINLITDGTGRGIVRFSSGGTINSTSNYIVHFDTNGTVGTSTTTELLTFGNSVAAGGSLNAHLSVFNPAPATRTDVIASSMARASTGTAAAIWSQTAAYYAGDTAFDGISITGSASTITGNLRVYGLRNS